MVGGCNAFVPFRKFSDVKFFDYVLEKSPSQVLTISVSRCPGRNTCTVVRHRWAAGTRPLRHAASSPSELRLRWPTAMPADRRWTALRRHDLSRPRSFPATIKQITVRRSDTVLRRRVRVAFFFDFWIDSG